MEGTMKSKYAAIILFGCLPMAACQPSKATGPSRLFSVAVQGRVATETGAPVAGAAVQINSVDIGSRSSSGGKCTGDARIPVAAVTAADGSFLTEITAGGIPVTLCVTVNVTAPAGSGLGPASAVADTVVLSSPGVDTLSFKLTLNKAL
jgi:hypothetical protein